ncbi:hypothetical protein D3C75_888040 [compost metagenome]
MGNGAHHQQPHAAVQHMQRVAVQVEEEYVAQAQHQARHGHRDEAEQAQRMVEQALALGLLHQVGTGEDHDAADQCGANGHGHAIAVGQPAATGSVFEQVVAQRQRQVVGPESDQRGVHRHTDHHQQRRAHQQHNGQEAGIAAA